MKIINFRDEKNFARALYKSGDDLVFRFPKYIVKKYGLKQGFVVRILEMEILGKKGIIPIEELEKQGDENATRPE
ncbi:hypothetical protein DRJ19_01340 [Candidatus Woesearchaeota archaeon]|nr:MAG: hypothetical protein DRJ19_01340 [Candidatus Woesearchaeota archaeon]